MLNARYVLWSLLWCEALQVLMPSSNLLPVPDSVSWLVAYTYVLKWIIFDICTYTCLDTVYNGKPCMHKRDLAPDQWTEIHFVSWYQNHWVIAFWWSIFKGTQTIIHIYLHWKDGSPLAYYHHGCARECRMCLLRLQRHWQIFNHIRFIFT